MHIIGLYSVWYGLEILCVTLNVSFCNGCEEGVVKYQYYLTISNARTSHILFQFKEEG